ncbi:MAG: replication-associated recombination protein A [Oligoflexia bacterium]|nr:replication-associated recombination protein A [Oligoflexia bacterium]MBF0365111.1 replication-associated recombination protein A [Oligoflexia bacterium]
MKKMAPKTATANSEAPLAYKLRPKCKEDFVGYCELTSKYPVLLQRPLASLVIWGPPGSGKTSLASLLAKEAHQELFTFSAVLGSVGDLRKLMSDVVSTRDLYEGRKAIIFIDEIHRFNKAQQDALLPAVEAGDFTLIGATTENPRYSVNPALLSRLHVIELGKFSMEDLRKILNRALEKQSVGIAMSEEVLSLLSEFSDGDARKALNHLELLLSRSQNQNQEAVNWDALKRLLFQNNRNYDRKQNRHYDVISAFIKSMRGSDPDSALIWLAIMLDGGEDPLFIARRLVIFASEDIGNADPMGLLVATSALTALQNVGLPEAAINLAQAVTYLASTVKSNAAYEGLRRAQEVIAKHATIEVPAHLVSSGNSSYQYPHNFKGHFVRQNYCNLKHPPLYRPTTIGREKFFQERLKELWGDHNHDHEKN